MIEAAKTEAEMREAQTPWPKTEKDLFAYIHSLVDREHDYGTCVYAMSLAANAAFNYVAHKLGTTGFQASCGDFDFLKRRRSIKGPFILLKAEDAVYPQYDLPERLREFLEESKPWIKAQAIENLAKDSRYASPNVIEHWKELAK